MNFIKAITCSVITLALVLLLNGNITIPNSDLPPLAKILDPVSGLWANAVKDGHYQDLSLTSKHLRNSVTISYDERKVPHIFAQNLEDAIFAQGYVESKDRMFQMDFIRRFASGQLSEILGERTIKIDQAQRRKGLDYAAEQAIQGWEKFPEKLKLIDAYLNGVNTALTEIDASNLPVEFKLIGIPKRPFTRLDGARVLKWMSDVLCGRSYDIANNNMVRILGKEDFELLFPEKPGNVDPVIPASKNYSFDSLLIPNNQGWMDATEELTKVVEAAMSPMGIGSNNWAVKQELTQRNAPIYASDPHLQLTLPSIWYEVSIHLPETNAYGVSIPGMPGLMMGFNDRIAWGETNVAWDVKDYFKIKWLDKSQLIYELDGKPIKAKTRIENFKVKGKPDVLDTVIYTYWGPLQYQNRDLALRWLPHDTPDMPEFYTFIGTLIAKNYQEYLDNTSYFIAPAQNFAFASKDGDVAIRVNGRFPALTYQDGKFIQDGSNTKNDWQKYIPRDQNPQIINPQRGFVSSANQRSTDDTYPYYYYGGFEHYRNRTLNELLGSSKNHSINDMMTYQASTYSKKAEEILPYFVSVLDSAKLTKEENDFLQKLKVWDYHYRPESEAATIFNELYNESLILSFEEFKKLEDSVSVRYPESWAFNEVIKNHPEHPIFDNVDTEVYENAYDIILGAYKNIVSSLQEEENLEWGKYRTMNIYHLARVPSFSAMDLQVGGHPSALNAIGNSFGPSWRMIVSLEEPIKAYGVFPGGQAGNPFSKYYKYSLKKWTNNDYFELPLYHSIDDIKNPLFTIEMHENEK